MHNCVITAEADGEGRGRVRYMVWYNGRAEDIRDDLGVLLVVLGERTRRAGHAIEVSARDIAVQERRIRDLHLVECQHVVEGAERDLETISFSNPKRRHTKKKRKERVSLHSQIDDLKSLVRIEA